ncbi:YidH family protein [Ruania halotolerans]|uniref:YidH family protein n=1 Tax=Ruania halotolerans TaxID=2897773 RepID=UPI001E3923F4|nr:DUF202 domain-containing protein [Ruania halotolerans]UFU05607.1 DUF202 domain-containing protein [Ruania halotolerans]
MCEGETREALGVEPAEYDDEDDRVEAGSGEGTGAADEAERETRRPQSVYGVGTEPDVRFSLANERTALAWLRTGLTLVAGGVALTTLASFGDGHAVLDVIAALACLAGGVLALAAISGWRRRERALRLGDPLPAPRILPVLVGAVAVFALLMAGYAVYQVLM